MSGVLDRTLAISESATQAFAEQESVLFRRNLFIHPSDNAANNLGPYPLW